MDGNFLVEAEADSLKERRRLAATGHVTVAAIVSGGDLVSEIDIRCMGVPETEDFDIEDFMDELADAAEEAFKRMGKKDKRDEGAVEEVLRRAVRREANRIWGKKPHVEAIVLST